VKKQALALAAVLAGTSACSAVRNVYEQPGYSHDGDTSIKRIGVTAWAPAENKGLSDTLAAVATDLVKLRKNYLVYDTQPTTRSFAEMCKDKIEGVLVARTLGVKKEGGDVNLNVALELYRCKDGALVWRADGAEAVDSKDSDLEKLTSNYSSSVGEPAKTYAAPAFSLLQQLVAELPDPVLTDADISEKIELG
jgi:probable lipoprotein (TIGR04455 family)